MLRTYKTIVPMLYSGDVAFMDFLAVFKYLREWRTYRDSLYGGYHAIHIENGDGHILSIYNPDCTIILSSECIFLRSITGQHRDFYEFLIHYELYGRKEVRKLQRLILAGI